MRSRSVTGADDADPVVRAHRLSDLGIMQALRIAGVASVRHARRGWTDLQLDEVEALCLEGNGAFSCIKRLKPGAKSDVLGPFPTLPTS